MRAWICTLLIASLALVSACARPQSGGPDVQQGAAGKGDGMSFTPPAPGELLSADGQPLSRADFGKLAAGYDYVLLGEHHGNPCVQQSQGSLTLAMAKAGAAPVVGVEWVSVDRQPVLDDFNAGRLTLSELHGKLSWERTWGHAWDSYAPVFVSLRNAGLPVHALNVPRDLVRTVSEKGADGLAGLPQAQRRLAPATIIPPVPEQQEMLEEVFAGHAQREGISSEERQKRRERFFLVQGLWDTAMAQNAVALRRSTGRPVVILAGSGHVEFGWGIAHRLGIMDPNARVLLALPWSGPVQGRAAFEGADVFYYCPAAQVSRLGVTLRQEQDMVRIVEVEPGSRAAKAGARPGDVVEQLGDTPIHELKDMHEAGMRARTAGGPLRVLLRRGGQPVALTVDNPTAPEKDPFPDTQPMGGH